MEAEIQIPDDAEDDDEGVDDLPEKVRHIVEKYRGKKGDSEDETIIRRSKDEVHVWSSIGTDIVKILNRVGPVAQVYDSGQGVDIDVPASAFRGAHICFRRPGARRQLTEEQREAARQRLSEARKMRGKK